MTTASTTLLGLALPVTGELSGTWGDVVNASLTNLLDTAIAGTTTLSSDADVTLSTTTLAANQARQSIILWTAGGTATRTITAPAQSKSYVVINATTSSQSIKLVGAGPTAGITVIAGEKCLAAWNGSDFVKISTTAVHTRQVFLSGSSATYTTPASCRQIVVRAKGGGAGALGSSSDGTGTNGGTGGVTTFNSVSAAGGNAGTLANGGVSSTGGSGGAGTASVRIAGAAGYPRFVDYVSATNVAYMGGGGGGAGGATPRNAAVFGTGTGQAGTANTGGGGSAGSGASVAIASASPWSLYVGFGGGEGEYFELIINSPAATYTYTVGAGGTAGAAGTSGYAGGAGGSGYIIVDEYY